MAAEHVSLLPVLLIFLPLIGALLSFVFRRRAAGLGIATAVAVFVIAIALAFSLTRPQRYPVGGWGAPLGIDLVVDGLSLIMLLMSATVGLGVSLYAGGYFHARPQLARAFWPLWLGLWTALNGLFLAADIFNLYVTLELLGLSAVALAALGGSAAALGGAMRYLLVSLLGSLLYLLGVALLYHAFGSVDIALLGERASAQPVTLAALVLMTVGLILKTALFPFHFWLPPAHASASSPVSALLSALVVKASFYILLRLWLEIFEPLNPGRGVTELLGLLGALAVLWGSLQALRQTRLKLLIAYSTVAQLGYLFLGFPLAAAVGPAAWQAVIYLALSHALAKAALFMAAGNIVLFGGHDRIADLDRVVQRLPLSLAAFAIAGISLMGLPPSGGFIGKWLLLEAAIEAGQWWWVVIILIGGMLAAAYLFKVIGFAFTRAPVSHEANAVPPVMEWTALVLAVGTVLLGLWVSPLLAWLATGNPFGVGP
ncbi:complex I subunit 5 family protein [Thiohalophilus thiocyanatoxydans]|uniref:Multisubunit sodium/proton antiporter MrpD subunit n=1 Tax=Thiohalophilus thiocyanatoxydans TaxID=381308 RepID=A0A4R8INY6_9GAMM|nr:proton-conducting transporter membrane subunit [Thiohalophilus thiocyanatoxydans]TDY02606.1 multisubunit sodium/proton antiporter MrpD subunit [Thiohalophilus thiocyanatoxydans]